MEPLFIIKNEPTWDDSDIIDEGKFGWNFLETFKKYISDVKNEHRKQCISPSKRERICVNCDCTYKNNYKITWDDFRKISKDSHNYQILKKCFIFEDIYHKEYIWIEYRV